MVDIADKVEAIRKKKPWIAPSVASSGRLSFIHFPIVDCETAEDHGVRLVTSSWKNGYLYSGFSVRVLAICMYVMVCLPIKFSISRSYRQLDF